MLEQIRPLHGYAKYKQAKDLIYDQILRSGAQAGDKICTEAALIKELDISVTTVRRALGELVQEGILVRKVGKGTFLKKQIVDQKPSGGGSILLLGHNSWHFLREDVYYGRIVGALGRVIREAGLRQVVLTNDWGHDPEAELEDIRRHAPAAIVCPYGGIEDRPFVLGLLGLGIPLLIYNDPLQGLAAGQVYFNDRQGGMDAATHLIERGYRELAMISLPKGSLTGRRRAAGFIEAAQRGRNCKLTGHVAAASYGETAGYQCVDGLMAGGHAPRAIFCGGDLLAYGAIKRLEELGLSVPGDVAVIGYGDFKVSSFYHPQLTTIRMDLERMGREIGRWVIGVVQDGNSQDASSFVKELPVELVVRETT